jgi:hypothetical protein
VYSNVISKWIIGIEKENIKVGGGGEGGQEGKMNAGGLNNIRWTWRLVKKEGRRGCFCIL